MLQNRPIPRTIYFDYNATTPLDPAVREAMLPFLGEIWGNPSSVHHVGRRARPLLDDARERASKILGCKPSGVVFTCGGTESNNLAIFGTARLLKPNDRQLLANTVAFVVRGADSIALLAGLDWEGICASSGSACSAGSLNPSHVIVALGQRTQANFLVRFSLGRGSTAEEVILVEQVLPEIVRRAQLGNNPSFSC